MIYFLCLGLAMYRFRAVPNSAQRERVKKADIVTPTVQMSISEILPAIEARNALKRVIP